MLKTVLFCVVLGFVLYPGQSVSQPLQIDERFGVQVQFPEGWSLLSEDLYSPRLQGQIFASSNEDKWVVVERPLMLPQIKKEQWATGVPGYPLLYADSVSALPIDDWLFEPPDFNKYVFSDYPNGVSVFYGASSGWLGYVVFISRSETFIKINITADKGAVEPDVAVLQSILSSLTFSEDLPIVNEDPYTLAERMYMYDRDYERAILLYEQVPNGHPKYADAQRAIGYRILAKQFDNWEAAVPYVEEAYKVAPDDPNVLEDIGRVYLKTNRLQEGINLLEKAGTRTARQAIDQVQ